MRVGRCIGEKGSEGSGQVVGGLECKNRSSGLGEEEGRRGGGRGGDERGKERGGEERGGKERGGEEREGKEREGEEREGGKRGGKERGGEEREEVMQPLYKLLPKMDIQKKSIIQLINSL